MGFQGKAVDWEGGERGGVTGKINQKKSGQIDKKVLVSKKGRIFQ